MTGAGKNFFLALNFFSCIGRSGSCVADFHHHSFSDRHMDADNEEGFADYSALKQKKR
jgi:hypothetical protein